MAFCIECKCCEAQPNFTKCVFCEDGVACPGRQRAARNTVTPAPSRALIPPTPTESKRAAVRRIRNPRSPWRGEAGLHLSDKAPTKPTTTDSAAALQEAAAEPQQVVQVPTAGKDRQEEEERTAMNKRVCACGCGTELPQDGKFEYVRGHKTKGDKPKRVCACGCGRPLVNRHPYIKGHNPDAKKTSARPRSPRNGKDYKASPPAILFPDRHPNQTA
jgi:hypothetical protein